LTRRSFVVLTIVTDRNVKIIAEHSDFPCSLKTQLSGRVYRQAPKMAQNCGAPDAEHSRRSAFGEWKFGPTDPRIFLETRLLQAVNGPVRTRTPQL
jgi:hypothetical protein